MTKNKTEAGRLGEVLAAEYLEKQGYTIVERNYKNRIGEIDIIAYDRDVLCFVEVKTRFDDEYGSPFEAVTLSKQIKISKTARWYLAHKSFDDQEARFDVVGIWIKEGAEPEIELIQNAFQLPDLA